MTEVLTLLDLRKTYHEQICSNLLGIRSGALSVADSSSVSSKRLAEHMAKEMGFPLCPHPPEGQTLGSRFTQFTMQFLEAAFERFKHLRPGLWVVSGSQASPGIAAFDQYRHLAALQKVLEQYPELKAALGGDYLITPDITIAREPISDDEINRVSDVIPPTDKVGTHTPLRVANYDPKHRILHASISCKWTMRSDRSQNTRTEALNLIRNRKGNAPHIVAVTLEPMPSRIAIVAMGTNDLNCIYHAALYELQKAVSESGFEDQQEILNSLIADRHLRDISDLSFDLAV